MALSYVDDGPKRFRNEKVSETAVVTAYGRAGLNIPYADKIVDLAVHMRKREITENPEREQQIESTGKGMASQLEARHLLVNVLLENSGVRQILEIASGLSPRGLYMTESDSGLRYVEFELPQMAHTKKEIVRQIVGQGNRRQNLHIFSGDALDRRDLKEAVRVGRFDSNEPIAVIHEGMLRYFSFPQKAVFAGHVEALLDWFGNEGEEGAKKTKNINAGRGVWITPDITLRQVMVVEDQMNAGQNKLLSGISDMNIYANAFESVQDAKVFFERLGFRMEIHPYTEVFGKLVSPGKMGLSKEKARAMIEGGVAVAMRLER